jgi:hypothetical protein
MMAQATYRFCLHRNITLFGFIKQNEKDSQVDEFLSYLFAGLGFYTQFVLGFKLPSPLNLLLSPFTIAEYYLRWTITSKDGR